MSALAYSGNITKKVMCCSPLRRSFPLAITPSKIIPIDVVKTADFSQAPAQTSTQRCRLLSLNISAEGMNGSSRRFAHTDVKFPDMSYYRRESTLDPEKSARDTEDERRALPHAVYYGALIETDTTFSWRCDVLVGNKGNGSRHCLFQGDFLVVHPGKP
ncbi:hypothetical protein Y032_0301g1843 [Ancylostoma ceylanicum]|uniref:Cytochrome b-c1 complex subunit Rieske transmembrane domain-containing protein n=1 Tax=Ancylostoma ceylanicum TaxID=53326 RepID=A0A016S3S9_9BILA|nr:hypothetical protein Y032_0301g1843 [Ancylostoma ceylanicum]